LFFSAEREREFDRDRDRERDSIFRIRERTRWLDTALREESSTGGRLDHDRTDTVLGFDPKTKTASQNALMFGEELQYWLDKVCTFPQNLSTYQIRKGSPYSIAEHRVLELIPVLGSQPE